jgi:hypothetical protein
MPDVFAGFWSDALLNTNTKLLKSTSFSVYLDAACTSLATTYTDRTKNTAVHAWVTDNAGQAEIFATPGTYWIYIDGSMPARQIAVQPDLADDPPSSDVLLKANNLSDLNNVASALGNLGLGGTRITVIGDDGGVQALDKVPLGTAISKTVARQIPVTKHDIQISSGPWGEAAASADNRNVWGHQFIKLRKLIDAARITSVAWYLDDAAVAGWDGRGPHPTPNTSPIDTQTVAPYALGGVNADGSMVGYDFSAVTPDQALHTLSAIVTYEGNGSTKGATVSLWVQNVPYDGMTLLATAGGAVSVPRGRYIAYGAFIGSTLGGKYYGSHGDCTTHATTLELIANNGPVDWDGQVDLFGGNVTFRGQHKFNGQVNVRGEDNSTIEGDGVWKAEFTNPVWQNCEIPAYRTANGFLGDVLAASVANVVLGSFGLGVLDGIQTLATNRYLLSFQTTASENGIYTVNSGGVWTKAADTIVQWSRVHVLSGDTNGQKAFVNTAPSGSNAWLPFTYGTSGLAINKSGALGAYQTNIVTGIRLRDFFIHDVKEDGIFLVHTLNVEITDGLIERCADQGGGSVLTGLLHSDHIQFGGDNKNTYINRVNSSGNIRLKSDFGDIENTYLNDVVIHDGPTQVYQLECTTAATAPFGVGGATGNIVNINYSSVHVWGGSFYNYIEDGNGTITKTGQPIFHNPFDSSTDADLIPPSFQGKRRPPMVVDLAKNYGTGTAVSVPRPTSSAPGHVFVTLISVSDPTVTVTAPGGWVAAGNSGAASTGRVYAFWRPFTSLVSGDGQLGPYAFTLSGSCNWSADIRALRNADQTAPIEDIQWTLNNSPSGTLSLPSATSLDTQRVAVRQASVFGIDPSVSWGAPPLSYAISVSANLNYNPRGRGAYDSTKYYQAGDLVTSSGVWYLCTRSAPFHNQAPPNGGYWSVWTGPTSSAVVSNVYQQLFADFTPTGALGAVTVNIPAGASSAIGCTYVVKPRYPKGQPDRYSFAGLMAESIAFRPSSTIPANNPQDAIDYLGSLVAAAATNATVGQAQADAQWNSLVEAYRRSAPFLTRPDLATTGTRGRALTTWVGDFNTSSDGQVIDGLLITGNLNLNHKNVRINETWVQGYARNFYSPNSGTGRHIFTYCEIGSDSGVVTVGKGGICFDGYMAIGCYIHGVGDGFKVGRECKLYSNYVTKLYVYGLNSDITQAPFEHCDGIQIQGSVPGDQNIDILGNFLDATNAFGPGSTSGAGSNSAFLIKADLGPIDNVRVEYNWLRCDSLVPTYVTAGNWTAAPNPTRVRFRYNRIIPHASNTSPFRLDDQSFMAYNRYEDINGNYLGPVDANPIVGKNGVWLDGVNNTSNVSTPYVAARVPQSLYVDADIAPASLNTGATQRIISAVDFTSNAPRTFSLYIDSTGHIGFTWWKDAAGGSVSTSSSLTLAALGAQVGGRFKIGVWLAPTSPYKVHFFFGAYGEAYQEIEVQTGSGAAVVNDGNTPIVLSGRGTSSGINSADRYKGSVYYASIRDGATGSLGSLGNLVAVFDPSSIAITDSRTPSTLTATTSEVWSLGSGALGAQSYWIASKTLAASDYASHAKPKAAGQASSGAGNTTYSLSDHQHPMWNPVTVTFAMSPYQIIPGDYVKADPTAGNISLLPPTNAAGVTYACAKMDSGGNTVTLTGAVVDGVTSPVLTAQFDRKCVLGDGSAWTTFSEKSAASGILPSIVTTKGDLIVGSASGAVSRYGAGADGTIDYNDSSQTLGKIAKLPYTGLVVVTSQLVLSNTTTETVVHGPYTVPAGSVIAGRTYRWTLWGSVDNIAAGSVTLKFRYGGVAGNSFGTYGISNASIKTNQSFKYHGVCTFRAASGSSVPLVAGIDTFNSTNNSSNFLQTTASNVNTTTDKDLVITAVWGGADPANVLRIEGGSWELVK